MKQEKPSLIPVISLYPDPKNLVRNTRARSKSLKGNEEPMKLVEKPNQVDRRGGVQEVLKEIVPKPISKVTRRSKSLSKKSENKEGNKKENVPLSSASASISEEESMYQTAHSTPILEHLKEGVTE